MEAACGRRVLVFLRESAKWLAKCHLAARGRAQQTNLFDRARFTSSKKEALSNMTETELNTFRMTLERKQAELANGNRNREALVIETSPDELDRIQHASARDNAMNNLERTSERLREVRSALCRINAGTFGICAACEESIHSKRLAAVPWALYCIVCQNGADREQKTPRGELDVSLAMTA